MSNVPVRVPFAMNEARVLARVKSHFPLVRVVPDGMRLGEPCGRAIGLSYGIPASRGATR